MQVCREIYEGFDRFYESVRHELGASDFGYSILYGPPAEQPPAFFIGYQPGGDDDDAAEGVMAGNHRGWPAEFAYVQGNWTLAQRVRDVFSPSFLERCTGTNLIFLRSPSIKRYNSLPLALRRRVRSECERGLREMVRAMQPRQLVFIGLGTLDSLGGSTPELFGSSGRVLGRVASVEGIPAISIIHLSGARISRGDRKLIANWLQLKVAET